MRKVFSFFILVCLFFFHLHLWSFSGLSTEAVNAYQYPKEINWIDMDDLKNRFKDKPSMPVGFDIDDTILFASAIVEKHCPGSDVNQLQVMSDLLYQKMNCDDVRFTMPKRIGRELIAFHQDRGDDIYFITARAFTPCVNEGYSINDWIKETFNIKNMRPVIFTDTDFGRSSKAKWLKEHKLAVYYGDSNSDMAAAKEAGILGIRVMRASNSTEINESHIGKYGEPVIRRSDI